MAKKKSNYIGGKTLDEKMMGQEPGVIENVVENDPRVSAAYNYYNYMFNSASGKKWVIEYMKNHSYTKEQISSVESAPHSQIGITACSVARIINNGTKLPDKSIKFLHDTIDKAIEVGSKIPASTPSSTPNIQDRIKQKQNAVIADVEDELDKFYNNNYTGTFSFYQFSQTKQLKPAHAKAVREYYTRLLDELKELTQPKPDKDLVEGYSHLNKSQIKSYYAFVSSICSDAERFSVNTKVVRSPRKKKAKSATDLIKGLKFKKDDAALKLTSANPETIIGAKALWVYNTKYKTIGVYYASTERGLNIKGSTVTQFNAATSLSKTARKPEEVIDKTLRASPAASKKILETLTTKENMMNGRINNETILLRVIK
jgi:hypothetical protein